jgi:hypothetical protein
LLLLLLSCCFFKQIIQHPEKFSHNVMYKNAMVYAKPSFKGKNYSTAREWQLHELPQQPHQESQSDPE